MRISGTTHLEEEQVYDFAGEVQRLAAGQTTRKQFLGRGLAAGVSFSVLASALAACGDGGGSGGDAKKGSGDKAPVSGKPPATPTGTLTVVDNQAPRVTNWDVHSSFGGLDARIWSMTYEPLIEIGEGGSIVPVLAESAERVSPTTLRVTLREGVRFHDGSPLTLADVKASLERLGREGSAVLFASLFTPFKVVEKGGQTFEIVCGKPFAPLEASLSIARIMQAKALADENLLKRANGTGPFRFVSRDSQKTVLEANPDYWDAGKPHIKTVVYRTIVDQTARVDALRTGAGDMLAEAQPAQVEAFLKDSKFYVPPQSAYSPAQYVYLFRQTGPFGDVRLRQAAAMAVDREAIARSILRGVDPVASSPLPTTDQFYEPLTPSFGYDPEQARALVQEATGGKGARITMASSTAFQFAPDADQAIAGYLRAVGIDVSIDRVDPGTYAAGVYTRYDLSLNALVETAPGEPDSLFSFYREPLFSAIFGRADPKLSELATRQRHVTGDARAAAVREAAQYIWERMPLLYLSDYYYPEIVSTRISNYNPTKTFGLVGVKDAWVAT